jgi:cytidylate kinase
MPVSPHEAVAVDGTAASGKSTFSRSLAERLGFMYVNTGAMYRGVTWYVQREGVDPRDAAAVERAVTRAGVESSLRDGELAFLIGGLDPLPHVLDSRVNEAVSFISQVAAVRRLLVAQQQRLAAHGPLVMEGRDIGTVVFPDTPYKFFIDADAGVRAERRRNQGEEDVIHQRDAIDSQRQHSPLLCAPDALRLDSGRHTVEELVKLALEHLAARGLKR